MTVSATSFTGDSDHARLPAAIAGNGAGAGMRGPAPRLFVRIYVAAAAGFIAGQLLALALYLLTWGERWGRGADRTRVRR